MIQRWRLSLTGATQLWAPEDYEATDGDVVPFQGVGLLLRKTSRKNKRGIEIVTLHVSATEIALLTDGWVADVDAPPRLVALR